MRLRVVSALLIAIAAGCADDKSNAIASRVEEAAGRLRSGNAGASVSVSYAPNAPAPYTIVFFPAAEVAKADVIAAGVEKDVADRIYSDLAYLGSFSNLLVVAQEGQRLSFTSSWKHAAEVPALLVAPRKTGTSQIELALHNGVAQIVALR